MVAFAFPGDLSLDIRSLTEFSPLKLEIDDPNELELDNLLSELHPKKILPKPMFDKPKAPAKARGPRRLVKNGDEA